MVELGKIARTYLIGRCGDDPVMAEGVVRVLFQNEPTRAVAKDLRLSRNSLRRKAAAVRRGLDRLITSGTVTAVELLQREGTS